jgi:hypothetical protein
MVNLPKNCRILYGKDSVYVYMIYATCLPTGEHDGVNVFKSPNSKKNYFQLSFSIEYQNDLPKKIRDAYFETKKKAMLFNRMKKVDMLKKEIDILSNTERASIKKIAHLRDDNQLPPPPKQIKLAF